MKKLFSVFILLGILLNISTTGYGAWVTAPNSAATGGTADTLSAAGIADLVMDQVFIDEVTTIAVQNNPTVDFSTDWLRNITNTSPGDSIFFADITTAYTNTPAHRQSLKDDFGDGTTAILTEPFLRPFDFGSQYSIVNRFRLHPANRAIKYVRLRTSDNTTTGNVVIDVIDADTLETGPGGSQEVLQRITKAVGVGDYSIEDGNFILTLDIADDLTTPTEDYHLSFGGDIDILYFGVWDAETRNLGTFFATDDDGRLIQFEQDATGLITIDAWESATLVTNGTVSTAATVTYTDSDTPVTAFTATEVGVTNFPATINLFRESDAVDVGTEVTYQSTAFPYTAEPQGGWYTRNRVLVGETLWEEETGGWSNAREIIGGVAVEVNYVDELAEEVVVVPDPDYQTREVVSLSVNTTINNANEDTYNGKIIHVEQAASQVELTFANDLSSGFQAEVITISTNGALVEGDGTNTVRASSGTGTGVTVGLSQGESLFVEVPNSTGGSGNLVITDLDKEVAGLSLTTVEFTAIDARFFGELGLPTGQGWAYTAGGSPDIVSGTVFGVTQDVVRINDMDGDNYQISYALTDADFTELENNGGFFGGVSRLEATDSNVDTIPDGKSGYFSGIRQVTGDRRYGITTRESGTSGVVEFVEADGGGGIFVSTVPLGDWYTWFLEVPPAFGDARLYVNGEDTGVDFGFNTNLGGSGTDIIIASGSGTGINRVSYHSFFGGVIYTESSTRTITTSELGTSVTDIILPPGKRDYVISIADSSPRAIGEKINVVAQNTLGSFTLQTEVLGTPKTIFNGLHEQTVEVLRTGTVTYTNVLDQGAVYIGDIAPVTGAININGVALASQTALASTAEDTINLDTFEGNLAAFVTGTGANSGEIEILVAGTYIMTVEPQITRTAGGSSESAFIWAEVDPAGDNNWEDIPNSAIKKSAGSAGNSSVSPLTVVFKAAAGSKIRAMFAASAVTVELDYDAAAGAVPAIPAAIINITRVGEF